MKNLVSGLALLVVATIAGVYLYYNWKELVKFSPSFNARPLSEEKEQEGGLARVVIAGVVPGIVQDFKFSKS